MSTETSHANRQAVLYCPYCAEETLFPLETGGWECRSCLRAFSVTFLGLVPAEPSAPRSPHEHHASTCPTLAAQANRDLEGATPLEILTWAHEQFGGGLVVTSSMADTVMIHLAEQVAPGIDVIFLDTGYHFVETIGTRDAVKLVHHVNVINVTPEQTVAEQDATWGKDLFARDPDRCCALRKVAPARQGPGAVRRLGQRTAARRLAGARRTRRSCPGTRREVDQDRADRHLDRRGRRRLHRDQQPDDQPAARGRLHLHRLRALHLQRPADDPRAGRWAGLAKTECGIHL